MRFRLTRASYSITNEDAEIDISSIEELLAIAEKEGHDLIIWRADPPFIQLPTICIYDDYIE